MKLCKSKHFKLATANEIPVIVSSLVAHHHRISAIQSTGDFICL